jgi:UDP-glucose 4-epimerase
MANRYLVTGGAGFIGSHLVLTLRDQGAEVVVLDNLSIGHAGAVPAGVRLVIADLHNAAAVRDLLSQGPWDAVFHFAALSLVGDSMQRPFTYFRDNVVGGLNLLEACVQAGVTRLVLSSTANLFGTPATIPIPDDAPIQPSSPYGESKRMLEQMLHWADALHGLRSARLRYFNAAGADPVGRAGEDHRPETHLIPAAIDAALGRRDPLLLFGEDYPTPDGTCIRDYVHVTDLAQAHLQVLPLLATGSVSLNVGTGRGFSVREVIAAVGRVTGRPVPVLPAPRRAGDPAVLVADATRLRARTGWAPRYIALDDMVATAHAWRADHPHGYAT